MHRIMQWGLLALVIVSSSWAPPSWAQPGTRRANDLNPQQLMAGQLTVLAKQAMMGQGQPRADQLIRARQLLTLALELDADQPELWRLRSELAAHESDTPTQMASLRKYLTLAPHDDRAQLQLIRSLIDQQQTLDSRLDALERFLNAQAGRRLSKPLRSRLALYAAVAARELGDDAQFGRWLQQAVKLDPANPQATQLIYELAVMRGGTPLQLGLAGIARARAMPLDALARLDLAQILLNEAAFYQAAQQFDTMTHLLQGLPDSQQVYVWIHSLGAASRTADALRLLTNYETYVRSQRTPQDAQDAADEEVDAILPVEMELLRLAILHSAPDDLNADQADAAYARLRKTLIEREADDAQAARLDYAWISALFGRELDEVELTLQAMPANNPLAQRAKGWLAIHKKDPQAARDALTALAQDDPIAKLGMAQLLKDTDDEQRLALQAIVFDDPVSLAGLLAARKLTASRRDVRPTRTGSILVKKMRDYPDRLWRADIKSSPWVDLKLRLEPKRFGYLQKIPASVSIKNLSGVALAVASGSDTAAPSAGTLPSTVLLTLTPSLNGRRTAPLPPIVLNLDRQLTLGPADTITIPLRLDESLFGLIASPNPAQTVNLRVGGLLDPVMTSHGRMAPGILGIRDTLSGINIPGQSPSVEHINQWIEQLTSDDQARQMIALARLMLVLASPAEALNDVLTAQKLTDTLNDLYPTLDPLGQAWVVTFLTPPVREQSLLPRIVDHAQRSEAPLVRILWLSTQVHDIDSPVLAAALRSDNKEIHAYAQAIRDALLAQAQETSDDPDTPDDAAKRE